MRTIGTLDNEQAAARFGDFLSVQGIDHQVENEDDGTFSIWIPEERQMSKAAEMLREFRSNPQGEVFLDAPRLAQLRREEQECKERHRRSTVVDSARLGYERSASGKAWLTLSLILICVGVGIYSGLGKENQIARFLHISELVSDDTTGIFFNFFTRTIAPNGAWLSEVRQGEIWRLVTPIFLHFNVLHLLFNMMMLREFGSWCSAPPCSPTWARCSGRARTLAECPGSITGCWGSCGSGANTTLARASSSTRAA
jgi:GlpG protein